MLNVNERMNFRKNELLPTYFKESGKEYLFLDYHLESRKNPNGDIEYTYKLMYQDIQPEPAQKSREESIKSNKELSEKSSKFEKKASNLSLTSPQSGSTGTTSSDSQSFSDEAPKTKNKIKSVAPKTPIINGNSIKANESRSNVCEFLTKDCVCITFVIFHPANSKNNKTSLAKTTLSREFKKTVTLHQALFEYYDTFNVLAGNPNVEPQLSYSLKDSGNSMKITKEVSNKTFEELLKNEIQTRQFKIYVDLTETKK